MTTASTRVQIRHEADRLLASGLVDLLAELGEVHVVGSYALDLMTWRDLDIHVVCDRVETDAFFRLGAGVAKLLQPHRMHFRDERSVGTPGLPRGLYWGIHLKGEPAEAWKVDTWLTDRAGFVFALGPWLGKVFPDLLGERIFPTRQEVFYLGPAPGDRRFAPPQMPVWVDFAEEIYGRPDLETKGFKVAPDTHGPAIDPDTAERQVTPATLAKVRDFVARRFPGLKDAPLVASEVCQYENSSNGDFLIDRHPDFDNVWLVGGGSGHGFKHGPALGEYAAAHVLSGEAVDERFSLRTKEKVKKRAVY